MEEWLGMGGRMVRYPSSKRHTRGSIPAVAGGVITVKSILVGS